MNVKTDSTRESSFFFPHSISTHPLVTLLINGVCVEHSCLNASELTRVVKSSKSLPFHLYGDRWLQGLQRLPGDFPVLWNKESLAQGFRTTSTMQLRGSAMQSHVVLWKSLSETCFSPMSLLYVNNLPPQRGPQESILPGRHWNTKSGWCTALPCGSFKSFCSCTPSIKNPWNKSQLL